MINLQELQRISDAAKAELTAKVEADTTANLLQVTSTLCAVYKTLTKPMISKFGVFEGREIQKVSVLALIRADATRKGCSISTSFDFKTDWYLTERIKSWEENTKAVFGEVDPIVYEALDIHANDRNFPKETLLAWRDYQDELGEQIEEVK